MLSKRDKFAADLARSVFREAKNPVAGAGMGREARIATGAGRLDRKAYRVSGPATPHGMQFNRGSQRVVERQPCGDDCPLHQHDQSTRK